MNLISISYGLFLLSFLSIYWFVGREKLRLWILLVASVVFYSSYQPQYILFLFVLIFINYRLGLEIGTIQADSHRQRLILVRTGIAINILLLFSFKYLTPFLKFLLPDIVKNVGFDTFKLVAPLGISYFTFECIAYLVDIYRGSPATADFTKFATYKLLFTKVTSGPITRFHELANQFKTLKFPTPNVLADALWLIARGAVKKGLLADNIGIFVDICFSNLQRAGSTDIWLATFAYGLQLYLDFSGYVDIARGSAMLFGLMLPENFDSPYFSTSIADFWRRWHMTLGDWLRNYLYFPLGGSRVGLGRTCVNLMVVMVVCGIWHGATLGFLVWGMMHGLALIVHRLVAKISDTILLRRRYANEDGCQGHRTKLKQFWQNPIGIILAWFLTQLMVFTSWIWFRLPNLSDSTLAVQHMWGHSADTQFAQLVYVDALKISQYHLTILLFALATCFFVGYFFKQELKLQLNWYLKLLFVPLCFYAVWLLAPEGSLPFIYFDY